MSAVNLTPCDEQTAIDMSKALFDHARQINRYARTYPAVFASLTDAEKSKEKLVQFAKNVARMVKEMYGLLLMARYKGISRFCNIEQIEAFMGEAEEIGLRIAEQNEPEESVIDATSALFN